MTIAVVAETRPGERRVALVPELVSRLADTGQEVAVEPGAGEAAGFTDDDYREAGATGAADALDGAGAALSVQPIGTHRVAEADVLITTAAVPGRSAPLLVTAETVAAMSQGSVVVDLAAESGGNVEGAKPGDEITIGGALVWGGFNVPSQLPARASQLYRTNVVNLLLLMHSDSDLEPDLRPDFDDEIIAGCRVPYAGEVRHAPTRDLLGEDVS
ncbi:MAG: hypothetical protein GEV28_35210 [Actinophytocola sp.]|uniref:hypothetical protein n=1 Tax=Actinophytocola sp. TaxID=1872138 RepID=UPI00132C0B4E|nr:hypothetical protein [Actinophytocola sp.]MPZ85356.1 hypothetical protein [Actinophytocola sp.]